jgi:hypothetical protein
MCSNVNLLKPNGKFTYHRDYKKKNLHADYIAFMCFIWVSEQTVNFVLHIINRLVFITEMERVYCAIRAESLYNTDKFRPWGVKCLLARLHIVHILQ